MQRKKIDSTLARQAQKEGIFGEEICGIAEEIGQAGEKVQCQQEEEILCRANSLGKLCGRIQGGSRCRVGVM